MADDMNQNAVVMLQEEPEARFDYVLSKNSRDVLILDAYIPENEIRKDAFERYFPSLKVLIIREDVSRGYLESVCQETSVTLVVLPWCSDAFRQEMSSILNRDRGHHRVHVRNSIDRDLGF